MTKSYIQHIFPPKIEITAPPSLDKLLLASTRHHTLLKKYNRFFNSFFRFNVIAFGYERLSLTGGYMGFSNEPSLAEIYVEAKTYEDPLVIMLDRKSFSNFGFIEVASHWGLKYYEFRKQMKKQMGIDLSFYFAEKNQMYYEVFVWNYALDPHQIDQKEVIQQTILSDYLKHCEAIQKCIRELKEALSVELKEPALEVALPNTHVFYSDPTHLKENRLLQTPFLSEEDTYLANIRLSSRKKRVLDYYLQGMTAKEMTKEMPLSIRTIENHIRSLKHELHANTRNDIVEKARKISLLEKYQ